MNLVSESKKWNAGWLRVRVLSGCRRSCWLFSAALISTAGSQASLLCRLLHFHPRPLLRKMMVKA